jgi:hypothetical protein
VRKRTKHPESLCVEPTHVEKLSRPGFKKGSPQKFVIKSFEKESLLEKFK